MTSLSKRNRAHAELVQVGKVYTADEGIALLQQATPTKFAQTVEAHVRLGVDVKKSDQGVRGSTVLPHGTGVSIRVAVFAQGANADAAKAAGADIVGFDDLAETIKKGELNFDVLIAAPDAMGLVGRLGQILGPRNLMPNPKMGTVTPDVASAVKKAKAGQARFRADKGGIIHCGIGKLDFSTQAIRENLSALIADLRRLKPSTSKGIYLRKITLSSTMGPGITIDPATLDV